ncbi:MAG: hypothetical protein GOMPHAMPRED_002112 [Gomphillus americanus]|uniref:C2H2-type domain-containing protein n=1 Tax=Gomphillus americanus TaxID=1940652 RepID=A0A8H3F8M7_9LECA|nr:MAG: hypothetical protein GOMPHAMPRED_002112 [Gomphillus americanus]
MSNNPLTIDPSIAASTPTYPGPYSPYAPQGHDMGQHAGHYPPAYPPWAGYGAHPHMQYNSPPSTASTPTTAPPRPGQQVYSFVPIPGAQQTKRPRRRYEEIERMYKCGHENCEKAYGTLNHLNAHVTMQEFKEIRKEWKQRKKEEEASRKGDSNDGRRVDSGPEAQLTGAVSSPDSAPTPTSQTFNSSRPQLPPLGYTGGNNNGGSTPYQSSDPIYQNGNPQVYSTYPHAPYNSSPQVYQR